jgi:hypothetical protein
MWVRCGQIEQIYERCRCSVSPGFMRRGRAGLGETAACAAGNKSCLRIINLKRSMFEIFGASPGITDSSRTSAGTNTTKDDSKGLQSLHPTTKGRQPGTCFCGQKHWYKDCFHINPTICPRGRKPRPEIQVEIEEAKRNAKMAERFQRAVARNE